MLTHHIQQSQLISVNLDLWKSLSKDHVSHQSELKIEDFVANGRRLDPELKDKRGIYYDQIINAQK